MKNVLVSFEAWEEVSLYDASCGQKLVGYQEICCHMIFDVKMDRQFTHNSCYVADSHTTDSPYSITYYIVFSRDSVRISFTLSDLNDIDIRASDIGNAYFNAKC